MIDPDHVGKPVLELLITDIHGQSTSLTLRPEDLENTKTKGKYSIGRDPKIMDFVTDASLE